MAEGGPLPGPSSFRLIRNNPLVFPPSIHPPSSSGFPRVSLRSFLLNSPFTRRNKTKTRHNNKTKVSSICSESDSNSDSSGVFRSEHTPEMIEFPPPFRGSIKRHVPSLKHSSAGGARRYSSSSRAMSRGGSCSSEPGNSCNPPSSAVLPGAVGGTSDVCLNIGRKPTESTSSSKGTRECPLCLQEVASELFPVLISCAHSACLSCLRQYLTVEITESRVNVTCPQCQDLMHPTDIHQIVANSLLSYKFEDFMLRRVLSMDPDTRWCPAPDCGYAVIAAGCASCPKLKCERPGCNSYFCYHCKAEWHPNITCDMARAQRSPNGPFYFSSYSHDAQNNDDVKSCPRCQVLIVKMDDGSCNHMTCSVCGAEFCWLCMKEITDLHYLSPSGCTFWGKKPWSRKKKILWQLGTLVGAPLGIGLVASLAVPAMIIGIPIWVGRRLHTRYAQTSNHKRNLAMFGGITASAVVSPILAGLAVTIGVPILLAYVYGVVPISLCRSGGCGVTTSASGVRIAFDDENDMVIGLPLKQSEPSQVGAGTASIGEISCGASLSAASGAHALSECDRESASNTAIAPASLTGSIASSCFSRTHRLEVHVDIAHGGRSIASGETSSLAISEKSTHTVDTENASTRALAGSLLHYKLSESEAECTVGGDSASGVAELDSISRAGRPHVTNLYIESLPPSGSETNSAVLAGDGTDHDMRLDSVSAIITARQMSRHGCTEMGALEDTDGDGEESRTSSAVVVDVFCRRGTHDIREGSYEGENHFVKDDGHVGGFRYPVTMGDSVSTEGAYYSSECEVVSVHAGVRRAKSLEGTSDADHCEQVARRQSFHEMN